MPVTWNYRVSSALEPQFPHGTEEGSVNGEKDAQRTVFKNGSSCPTKHEKPTNTHFSSTFPNTTNSLKTTST